MVLAAAALARVNGTGVKVAYRQAADDGVFTTEKRMAGGGGNLSAILDLAQGTDYDLKIYYVDNNGDEVIVEWRRVTVPIY